MTRAIRQQILIFAAMFMMLQVGLDWAQGNTLSPERMVGLIGSTLVATVIYAAYLWWRHKRNTKGE